ncbi:hypothetical protein [Butyrivibrio sp. M55]|uniref:hypothetical protein n=1 Tax=Butyrivibrio sp. M55 TaxID=1855323 RepID=UPI0008ECCF96|nr:hypothetical protein [Butyrivibrio sp. M55]SFU57325.1 hypothetical protein SAMN05216540_10410 [Butyrivibrio sp. M55]
MGILEPITHTEEIQELLNDAKKVYDRAKNKFESQKKSTSKSLEKLGKVKISAWSSGMEAFVKAFESFKNIEMNKISFTNSKFIGCDEEPKQMLMNIENATMNAEEIAKAGIAAIGTGAIVGVAAYGGAMMFGTASTGTAIAALSGAAKTNATLAWFGGGAKAAGGLGMATGKLVLAGVIVAPIIGVAALIAGAKGKEKLAEAQKIHSEAENAASQMNIITTGMQGIENMSSNYIEFIKRFGKKFTPFIEELEKIKRAHMVEGSGEIDFDSLTVVEQKTLHLTWLMAQIYYHVLSVPILDASGVVSVEAKDALKASEKDLKQIRKEAFHMVGDEASAGNLVWKPIANKMLVINFIAMFFIILGATFLFTTSILKGILMWICSFVAFPIFLIYKDLPASRLYMLRLLRLVLAIGLALLIASV